MVEMIKKYATAFLPLLAVLLILPAVSYGAESGLSAGASGVKDSGGASSSPPSYSFPAGTTVESLTQQLAPQGQDAVLWVLKPDGNARSSGLIETGDRIEVLDQTGQVLSCVTALVEGSEETSSSSVSSSASSSSLPSQDGAETVFSPGTTVEFLQDELTADESDGARLKVKSHAGRIRGSGDICTGDTLSVLDADGNVLSTTKAIVPGDLTRCGLPTSGACDMLYAHLIRHSELTGDLLEAADLNRDGTVDTSDLLQLKKAVQNFN